MHAPSSSFVLLICVIVVLTNLSTVLPSSPPTAIPTTISSSTIAPISTPSSPTASPSTVPVGTDGYVYLQFYTAYDCGGSKSAVSGFLANYCNDIGDDYYIKYMFTKGR